ncbi:MAG TPA: ATP-binding protein [Ruminococcaceae bacterium]|nr:ATP-binding protein [Oscillospiraceae bacterium]
MKELKIEARTENLPEVLGFVDTLLEERECKMKPQMQIDVAVEEIFVNIAHYAYTEGVGEARIQVDFEGDPLSVAITFIDRGIPYDPLAKDDPDVTLSAAERQIGGLGIYMVKKSMDEVLYSHEDGCNIFTIKKKI